MRCSRRSHSVTPASRTRSPRPLSSFRPPRRDEGPRREDRGVEDDRLGVHHGEMKVTAGERVKEAAERAQQAARSRATRNDKCMRGDVGSCTASCNSERGSKSARRLWPQVRHAAAAGRLSFLIWRRRECSATYSVGSEVSSRQTPTRGGPLAFDAERGSRIAAQQHVPGRKEGFLQLRGVCRSAPPTLYLGSSAKSARPWLGLC